MGSERAVGTLWTINKFLLGLKKKLNTEINSIVNNCIFFRSNIVTVFLFKKRNYFFVIWEENAEYVSGPYM